jgi:hypothetical protein
MSISGVSRSIRGSGAAPRKWVKFCDFFAFFRKIFPKKLWGMSKISVARLVVLPTPKILPKKNFRKSPNGGRAPRLKREKSEKSNYDSLQNTRFRPSHSAYGMRGETSPPPPVTGVLRGTHPHHISPQPLCKGGAANFQKSKN